jgi:hypothetical protein
LFLGTENEMEVKSGYSADSIANDWKEAMPDFFICKHDGSLNNGFEVVTCPASLEIHKERWPILLGDKSLTQHVTAWDTTTCGLHINASRKPLSPLTCGKILVFVNSPLTRSRIVALAGRENYLSHGTCYAELSPKKITDGRTINRKRYEAVNLQNPDRVEFRLFKGTLNLRHVLADLEFIDALCRWAMNASIQDRESWASLWAFVMARKKYYPNLIAYMDSVSHRF